MSLLSPEQLAEARQEYNERVVAYRKFKMHELSKGTIMLRSLLDHIEAREQQVKAELQTLLRPASKVSESKAMGFYNGKAVGQNEEITLANNLIKEVAARLGITLD